MNELREKRLKDVSMEEFILYAKEEFGITIVPIESDNPTTFEELFGSYKKNTSNVSYEDEHIRVFGRVPALIYSIKDAVRYVETMCSECPHSIDCSGNKANTCNKIKEDVIRYANLRWGISPLSIHYELVDGIVNENNPLNLDNFNKIMDYVEPLKDYIDKTRNETSVLNITRDRDKNVSNDFVYFVDYVANIPDNETENVTVYSLAFSKDKDFATDFARRIRPDGLVINIG